eukprot:985493-Karenia_brevis.AAC.1
MQTDRALPASEGGTRPSAKLRSLSCTQGRGGYLGQCLKEVCGSVQLLRLKGEGSLICIRGLGCAASCGGSGRGDC